MKYGSALGHDTTRADGVQGLMPQLRVHLVELMAIPSVSGADYPAVSRPALLQARDVVAALFRDTDCEQVGSLDGTAIALMLPFLIALTT